MKKNILNIQPQKHPGGKIQYHFPVGVVSGIYFWVVESLDPASMGKIQKGTLAVIK